MSKKDNTIVGGPAGFIAFRMISRALLQAPDFENHSNQKIRDYKKALEDLRRGSNPYNGIMRKMKILEAVYQAVRPVYNDSQRERESVPKFYDFRITNK